MEFTVKLADVNIAVHSIHDTVYQMCRDYLTDGAPEMEVRITPEAIAFENAKNLQEAQFEGTEPVHYSDGYLETLAVYRQIAVQILERDTFLMHGAVIAVGNRAWLFTASSGTGKTTHIRLWLEHIQGSYIVNGDKPLIHVSETPIVYGTPWAGKEGMNCNIGVPLCGIVILERGAENHIEQVSFSQALPTLIQQSYRPTERKALETTLGLLSKLGNSIPLYRLHCNMEPEAALVAYEMLAKHEG